MMSNLLRSTILRLALVSLTGASLFPRPLSKPASPTGEPASMRALTVRSLMATTVTASALTASTLIDGAARFIAQADEGADERLVDSREATSVAESATASVRESASPASPSNAEDEDEDDTEKRNATRAQKSPSAYRLPRYFGKLKLTDDQRAEVLAVLKKRNPQIEALQLQLREIRESRTAELEEVLTKSQRNKLHQLNARRPS